MKTLNEVKTDIVLNESRDKDGYLKDKTDSVDITKGLKELKALKGDLDEIGKLMGASKNKPWDALLKRMEELGNPSGQFPYRVGDTPEQVVKDAKSVINIWIGESVSGIDEATKEEFEFYSNKTKVYKHHYVKGLEFRKSDPKDYRKPIAIFYKGKEVGKVTYDRDKDHLMAEFKDPKTMDALSAAGLKAQGWNSAPYRYASAGNMIAAVGYAVEGVVPKVYYTDRDPMDD